MFLLWVTFVTLLYMKKPVKLLVLTHNYPRHEGDFAGVFIALLLKHLTSHGIQPVVLAPHDPGAAEHETVDGIKIYRFRYADSDSEETIAYRGSMHKLVLGSVSGIFKFKQFLDRFRQAAFDIIKNEHIDVVAGHWLVPSGIVMKTLAKKTGLPMVLSSHGTDIRLMRKYAHAIYRYLKGFCRSLHRWTVVSGFLRNEILSVDPELESILEVLPLPHDETTFYRDEHIPREEHLVVSVTRFTAQKRVEVLIKAFARVIEKQPDTHLLIIGTGPLESEITQQVQTSGLNEHVTIGPPVPQTELRAVYNRATVVVLNSIDEGFGLALSEAMMCGAAVLGTASGGIVDIISHEKTGLLVEPDSTEALAHGILRLLEDSSFRQQLAEQGYQYAHHTYTSAPLAKKYAEIIHNAVM